MDSFFGIGPLELVMILIIAGVVMGPERMVQTARWLGRATATLQAMSRSFQDQLNRELDHIDQGGELKETLKEMRQVQKEVSQARQEIKQTVTSTLTGGQKAVNGAKAEAENNIQPPRPVSANSQPEAATPAGLPQALHIADDPE